MELYPALDVSLETTTVCVVDREGAIVFETISASDPDILADCLTPYRPHILRNLLVLGFQRSEVYPRASQAC